VPVKAKSAGILCGLQAFLLHSGADKRLLEAFYHYGAPPKGGVLCIFQNKRGGKLAPQAFCPTLVNAQQNRRSSDRRFLFCALVGPGVLDGPLSVLRGPSGRPVPTPSA